MWYGLFTILGSIRVPTCEIGRQPALRLLLLYVSLNDLTYVLGVGIAFCVALILGFGGLDPIIVNRRTRFEFIL